MSTDDPNEAVATDRYCDFGLFSNRCTNDPVHCSGVRYVTVTCLLPHRSHFRRARTFANGKSPPKCSRSLLTQSRRVQTRLAIRAVVKAVVHIFQQCGFEFGIVHAATIARTSCGALVDKSYSSS